MTPRRDLEPGDVLRGGWLGDGAVPVRVPAAATERWAADTIQAARVRAGVRLAFVGDADAVELDVTTGSPLTLATPGTADGYSAYVDGAHRSLTRVAAEWTGTVTVELPERAPDSVVDVYLPERFETQLRGLRVRGGALEPVAPGPRWLAYGDSITQGWTVPDGGAAWTETTRRATGLDLCNLGFAGAARGELPVAAHLAATPADVISLAWGTNCWAQIEMDASYIAELMRLFLATVRRGHPETPILVVSPVLRPAAEATRNGSGATLADLRDALEGAVIASVERHADEHLHLLRGGALLGEAQLDPDGIHPNVDGHRILGEAVAEELRRVVA